MASTKNALIRYKILDRCFSNPGKRYFLEDLIQECEKVLSEINPEIEGISRRQIFDDISFMESQEGWEIELSRIRDGRKVYYRYLNPTFSINNMPLNDLEINQLKSAVDILSQFKGMPQFEWVNELIPKLKQGIDDEKNQEIIIDFDNNQYLKGIDHLGPLYNAIHYKKVIKVSYQPYESVIPHEFIIHPYLLKQYNNRWFLYGYNPENGKSDWNLAIDRILSFKEIKAKFQKNETIDWKEYFDDLIGVTKPEAAAPETIVLHFIGKTGKYMETKPLHGSQKSKWLDDSILEVRLELIVNYEFERLLLSYADSVKVIKPKNLSKKIASRLINAINHYQTNN